MKIEITGRITAVEPAQEKTSARTGRTNRWQNFIVTEDEGQYPCSLMFTLWNDKLAHADLKIGDMVAVTAFARTREYNGRHFNDITGSSVTKQQAQTAAPAQPQTQPQAQPQSQGADDDLPF